MSEKNEVLLEKQVWRLEKERDAWRAACRYLYEIIPRENISQGDWGRVIALIGKAEMLGEDNGWQVD